MKQKWKNKEMFQYIISKDNFKLCFLFAICISVYGGAILVTNTQNVFSAFLLSFSFPIFQILFFALFFYNTYMTLTIVNRDLHNYIYRLGSKANYINSSIRLSILSNLYLLLLFLLMFLTAYNFLGPGISFNGEIDLGYFFFFFFRYFMIWILTCIILSYLYLISKVKLSYVFSCVFLIAILGYSYLLVPYQYLFFPGSLLDAYAQFPSFSIQLILSISFIIVLIMVLFLLYFYSRKNKGFDIV